MDILKVSGIFDDTPGYVLARHPHGIRRAVFAIIRRAVFAIIPLAFLGENQYTGEKGESNEEEILSVL